MGSSTAQEGGLPTYFLVCLHKPCNQEAARYIVDCLQRPQPGGLGGLVVQQERMTLPKTGLVLHVSATKERVFELAEIIGLKKRLLANGIMCAFKANKVDDYEGCETGGGIGVGPLSLSEVQRCILHAMESVHFEKDQKCLPGYGGRDPGTKKSRREIMSRSPVLQAFREAGFIDTFPMHDDESLRKVYAEWRRSPILSPPVETIRNYFGENVALYVSFTAFYTRFLIPTALLGLAKLFADSFLWPSNAGDQEETSTGGGYGNVAFALSNLIIVTLFLEFWKRRSNDHSYRWGTSGKLRLKKPRPEFRGDLGENPVTGELEVRYPFRKTLEKIVFVSMPVTLACLAVAFGLMLLSFESEVWMADFLGSPAGSWIPGLLSTILSFLPSVGYSVLVFLMNHQYLHLAHHLTDWENHRTQEQFERHVVFKLILFEFVNSFLALFYIGFYLRDMAMLKSQVQTMLVVQQVVNQIQETLLPVFLRRPSTRRVVNKICKKFEDSSSAVKKAQVIKGDDEKCLHDELGFLPTLDENNSSSQLVLANFNLKRDHYESTYDDFVELWLQFGSVFLFSSVYPLAAFLALLNNLFELRMDAVKLCKVARKPTPRGVRDIGAWYMAFSLTCTVSVLTNCALMAMDTGLRSSWDPGFGDLQWALLFVGIEHIFVAVRALISLLVPDVSSDVKLAMDRDDFYLKNRPVHE